MKLLLHRDFNNVPAKVVEKDGKCPSLEPHSGVAISTRRTSVGTIEVVVVQMFGHFRAETRVAEITACGQVMLASLCGSAPRLLEAMALVPLVHIPRRLVQLIQENFKTSLIVRLAENAQSTQRWSVHVGAWHHEIPGGGWSVMCHIAEIAGCIIFHGFEETLKIRVYHVTW